MPEFSTGGEGQLECRVRPAGIWDALGSPVSEEQPGENHRGLLPGQAHLADLCGLEAQGSNWLLGHCPLNSTPRVCRDCTS